MTEANKTAVRAGSTGYNVRYVLIASFALVIIAFVAIALFVKQWTLAKPTAGRTVDLIASAAKPLRVAHVRYGRTRPRRCSERGHRTQRHVGRRAAGDREDIRGRPFVGPAGLLLDRALAEAGIDRERVYVTNAVKHFKFEARGKRRLHKRPNASEIKICRRWLLDEIEAIGPRLIVALAVTAAQSLVGRAIPIQSNRGAALDLANGMRVLITRRRIWRPRASWVTNPALNERKERKAR